MATLSIRICGRRISERRTGLAVPGKEETDMFRIVNRLIQWTGKYKRRIYIGFIYALIHSIFTAIPIMLAANGLSAVLDDWGGVKPLAGRDIWIMLGAMILAVLGRYLFSYLRAITQESVGYEASADERIRLGDLLKRGSLGFF